MMSKKSLKASEMIQPMEKLSYCGRNAIRSVLVDKDVEWDWKGKKMLSLKDQSGAHCDHCAGSFVSSNPDPSLKVLTDADTDIAFPL